jgi:hypothetical protein
MFPLGGLTKVSKVVLFAFCEIVNRGKETAKSSLKEEMRLIGSILSDDTLNGYLSS